MICQNVILAAIFTYFMSGGTLNFIHSHIALFLWHISKYSYFLVGRCYTYFAYYSRLPV